MRTVSADHEVRTHPSPVGQGGLHAITALTQVGYPGVETVFGAVLGGLVEHIHQVAAQDLQLRHHAVAVERRHRHLGAAAAVGSHPRRATLFEGPVTHLLDQSHPLDHVSARAPEVDGLPTRSDSRSNLDDDHPVASAAEPEGK